MHVRQPHVAAVEAVRELFEVKPHEPQNRRVQVVDGFGILNGAVAVLIGRADDRAALDAAAGEPDSEARGL